MVSDCLLPVSWSTLTPKTASASSARLVLRVRWQKESHINYQTQSHRHNVSCEIILKNPHVCLLIEWVCIVLAEETSGSEEENMYYSPSSDPGFRSRKKKKPKAQSKTSQSLFSVFLSINHGLVAIQTDAKVKSVWHTQQNTQWCLGSFFISLYSCEVLVFFSLFFSQKEDKTVLKNKHGEFWLEVKNAVLFSVTQYEGYKDQHYICFHTTSICMYHQGKPKPALMIMLCYHHTVMSLWMHLFIIPGLVDEGTPVSDIKLPCRTHPHWLEPTIYQSETSAERSSTPSEGIGLESRSMVSVAVKISSQNAERNIKVKYSNIFLIPHADNTTVFEAVKPATSASYTAHMLLDLNCI